MTREEYENEIPNMKWKSTTEEYFIGHNYEKNQVKFVGGWSYDYFANEEGVIHSCIYFGLNCKKTYYIRDFKAEQEENA